MKLKLRLKSRHFKELSKFRQSVSKTWFALNSLLLISTFNLDVRTTLRRPHFEKLQRDIFNGKVGTVIVWKLDRLSRNLRDGINTLADWADRGLKVVSITQQLDSTVR